MHAQPFINVCVPNAGRCVFAPGQAGILNPCICVSGSASGANKKHIIFPEFDIGTALCTLLHANVPVLEISSIHTGALFLHRITFFNGC
jgi:hypothetical protein